MENKFATEVACVNCICSICKTKTSNTATVSIQEHANSLQCRAAKGTSLHGAMNTRCYIINCRDAKSGDHIWLLHLNLCVNVVNVDICVKR